ncbi:MAG: amino acid ABC transporter substrate-binding protein [Solirubrobacterales bacterium]|nr:amino acid ABC transporter substrate-binding protein [Solirubrobacterales bacterium]
MPSGRAITGILVLAALVFPGCSGGDGISSSTGTFEPVRADTLTVMTQPMPTAGFWEGTRENPTGGFEYEMAVDLAERLDLGDVEVRTAPFSAIVAGRLGGADLAMSLITPTADRDQVLDFTTPYIDAAPALLVREGTEIPDVHTAQEMQFAVGSDTTFETIVKEDIRPDAEPLRFENRNREIRAVLDGRADVAMFDLPAAEAIVNDDDRLAITAKLSSTEPIAAALPDGSTNVDAVGSALRAMEADGTIDSLSEKWLGTSITDSENSVPLLRTGS